jgi:cysteinyl-tRNA synthetase
LFREKNRRALSVLAAPAAAVVVRRWTTTSSSSSSDLKLYNSLTGRIESLSSHHHHHHHHDERKGLLCYTCGPTVYDAAHLGHARTYLWIDILRRCLQRSISSIGSISRPLFVMNITDVDDKILMAAAQKQEAPLDLARRHEAEFWRDWDALNLLRPDVVTRVSEHVDSDIVPYIERLVERGMAYNLDDDYDESTAGVYFDVRAYEDEMQTVTRYGKLAPSRVASDFYANSEAAAAVPTHNKRDPRDFVLWKKRKTGERLYWNSPWGPGRPGWHIECSAMIEAVQRQFQETHVLALHAGGVDLQFPHHTNEIAQAEAYHCDALKKTGTEWVPHWAHTGHLHIEGMKMSKSLKNFITIQVMLSSQDTASALSSPGDDFRLWCLGLSGSYRSHATYSEERIREAGVIRQKLVRFLLEAEEWLRRADVNGTKKWLVEDRALYETVQGAYANSVQAIFHDLDGSTYLKEMVRIAETGRDRVEQNGKGPIEPVLTAVQLLRELLSLVGFSDVTTRAGLSDSESSPTSHVVGGERALLNQVASFRSAVRQAALAELTKHKGDESEHVRTILKLCDEVRDDTFPRLGVELHDGGVNTTAAPGDEGSMWRFCVPRSVDAPGSVDGEMAADTSHQPPPKKSQSLDWKSVPLKDFFRVGRYEGQFSEFTDEGIPTLNADGTEISHRQWKKLRRKLEKHAERLGTPVTSSGHS